MKMVLLVAGVCGLAALIAVAAQTGEFDRRGPQSRLPVALDANHNDVISGAEMARR